MWIGHSHIGKSKITQDDSIWKYVCKDKIRRDIFAFLEGFLGGCAACSFCHIGKSKITQDDSIWKYVCKDKIRRDIFAFLEGFLGGCAACSFFYRFSFMLV